MLTMVNQGWVAYCIPPNHYTEHGANSRYRVYSYQYAVVCLECSVFIDRGNLDEHASSCISDQGTRGVLPQLAHRASAVFRSALLDDFRPDSDIDLLATIANDVD